GGTISGAGLFTAGATAGGPFTVTAASGGKSGTASVTVTSTSSQTPYGGVARAIPGRIECEDFDNGGEDVASDSTATVVGWAVAGEWLEYTVNAQAGTYALQVNVTSQGVGGSAHLE